MKQRTQTLGLPALPWGNMVDDYVNFSGDKAFLKEYSFISGELWNALGVGGFIELAKALGVKLG